MKNFYDMLSVANDAPADEIKKAFRREIARYHPDKVQHLGREFQEMAVGIAADLTEAYRILMDPALRVKYDEQFAGDGARAPMTPGRPSAPAAAAPVPPPPAPESFAGPAVPPPRPTAGLDFVKRATITKIRAAVEEVLSNATPVVAPGFDIAVLAPAKKGLFKKAEDSLCLLVKFVPHVDPESVADLWPRAAKVQAQGANGCVLLLVGQGMAPTRDLAAAVTDQRRKARNHGGPVLVPVDVRDWDALFPPDAPGAVRSLIQRLKDEKR